MRGREDKMHQPSQGVSPYCGWGDSRTVEINDNKHAEMNVTGKA